jgi:hypothetical protein
MRRFFITAVVTMLSATFVVAQQSPSPIPASSQGAKTPSAQDVPVIDGELGPCSLDLTVNDGGGKPVFGVKVKVRIVYGFMGVKKMDLEAQTNVNGKVRFAGLPNKVRNPPLEFKASKDDLIGLATTNPSIECKAQHDIVLEKPKPLDTGSGSPSPAATP